MFDADIAMEVTNSRDDFILTEVLAANIVYLLLTRAMFGMQCHKSISIVSHNVT